MSRPPASQKIIHWEAAVTQKEEIVSYFCSACFLIWEEYLQQASSVQ